MLQLYLTILTYICHYSTLTMSYLESLFKLIVKGMDFCTLLFTIDF